MRLIKTAVFAAILVLSASVVAEERATGNVAAAACASCHGVDGEGNGEIGLPALASLPRGYFVKQIEDFKSGERTSPIKTAYDERLTNSEVLRSDDPEAVADFYAHWMVGVAKGISIEDAKAAAGYYAGLDRAGIQAKAGNPRPVDPEVIALGEDLAINGDWERDIPPCFKCHAVDGVGVEPWFPPLAGQHPDYVVRQLKAWKNGARANDPLDLMKTLSENLTDDEIHAVAAYMATLGTQEKEDE